MDSRLRDLEAKGNDSLRKVAVTCKRNHLYVVTLLTLIIFAPLSSRQHKTAVPSIPCPIRADLWVLAGQSNMQAWGRLNEPLMLDSHRIMTFRMNNEWAEP